MEESENNECIGSEDKDDGTQLRHRKLMNSARETLDSASRLLRKKIPCTGHLMTPRKLWIQMVPTRECDVVVMFPPGASDSTLMWLLQRLKESSPGLQVQVRHHSSSNSYGFYLTAPFKVLLQAAEEYHLPKPVKIQLGGGLKEFVVVDAACFIAHDDESGFFTTQERQWLVLKLLHNLRAGAADVAERLTGVRLNEGQAIVPKLSSAGVISQVFPLHDMPILGRLQKTWVRAVLETQPLDEVCEYFGVKIAMYFAWLGHYTTALIAPAAVGFLFWIGFGRGDQATDDVGFVLFSLFNVLWASVYLEAWKRYSATLAYRWGTLDQRDDLLAEPRPLFKGPLEQSPVTNRLEPTYPDWKRNLFRYCVTVPVISLCLALVFVVMVIILQLQDWWDEVIESRGYPFFLSYFPKILLAVVITCLDDAYYKVACWLNEKENYRADSQFENHLIVKVALFQFVNSFLSLFYIAFYLQDLERLKEQLAALLITRQVIGNIKESALPYLLEQVRLAKLSFDLFGALSPTEAKETPSASPSRKPTGSRHVGQAELESTLFKYDGTFDDHLEMLVQLGYVVLFSSAFPMAACCALINNIIEIRSDAFKLCFIFQRPFGQRVASIGSWQSAMELMGITAVMVNCALIGLSGHVHRMFPNMSTTQTILLIVALEHVVLILRYVISHSIPDLPDWVATEMAKVEFARREAVRRSSAASTADAPASEQFGRFVVSASESQNEPMGEVEVMANPDIRIPRSKRPSESSTRDAGTAPGTPGTPGTPSTPEGKIQKIPPFNKPATPGTPDGKKVPSLSKPTTPDSKPPRREGMKAATPEARPPPRLHEWLTTEEPTQHLTIGSHAGADWVRRLALDKTRKTSEPSEDTLSGCRSTDCIPKEASSSDSDLLRSAPPWSRPRFRFSPESETKPALKTDSKSSLKSETKLEPEPTKPPSPVEASSSATAEDLAAKKQRVKQSLIKRARSVAIFSLKLKERRAREGKVEQKIEPPKPVRPPETVGGELACIPLEMLISVDDVAKDLQRRQHPPVHPPV